MATEGSMNSLYTRIIRRGLVSFLFILPYSVFLLGASLSRCIQQCNKARAHNIYVYDLCEHFVNHNHGHYVKSVTVHKFRLKHFEGLT